MNPTVINTDPRYTLFQQLIDSNVNKQPQPPLTVTELDIRRYLDEDWWEKEKAALFSDVPLIIGFSSMLKEPGEHFTFDLAGKPMLIVRGKDGQLRCFLNVCRHRGVRLANSPTISKLRTFACQYHHWTYDLTGKLIFVPSDESFPNLDRSCRSLVPLPIEEAHGFIWVNPNQNGTIDLANFLGNIAVDLDGFGIAQNHFYKQKIHTVQSNWKLIIEAFLDGYHVTRLHNKTVGGFFLDNESVIEREKQHTRSIVARKTFLEAIDLPPDAWDFRYHSSFSHYIYPNTITVIHPDYVSQLSLFPVAVDKTIVIHNCAVDQEPTTPKALAHFEKSFKLIDEGVFANEDFHVCEQAQIGLASRANQTHLVGGYERGIRLFQQILTDKMGPLPFDK